MTYCYLCDKEKTPSYFSYFCESCQIIKNLVDVYGEDVSVACKKVFMRNTDQQGYKINNIVKTPNQEDCKNVVKEVVESNNYNLRAKRP